MDAYEMRYGEFLIRDCSYEHRAGEWLPRAFVYDPAERGMTEYPPLLPPPEGINFSTRAEATRFSFDMGRAFVDRKLEGIL
jgi:hypothetical protein